jgi:hypothetical protein
LTGNYLGITQPSALYLIKQKLGDRVDLRFYSDMKRSFHPKSYIFHYNSYSEIYIGSSNISKSALTSGIEWNYRFTDKTDEKNYEKFFNTYEDLFNNHSIAIDDEQLRLYSKNWHRPLVSKDMDRYDETEDEVDRNVSNLFAPDYFDYIVIDEFHHAVNIYYQNIVNYFKPKFLLGLTATPDRMDGRNIYEICDYNVPYEISLRDAINKGMLVPFHYYGIYDDTDYSGYILLRGSMIRTSLTRFISGMYTAMM